MEVSFEYTPSNFGEMGPHDPFDDMLDDDDEDFMGYDYEDDDSEMWGLDYDSDLGNTIFDCFDLSTRITYF